MYIQIDNKKVEEQELPFILDQKTNIKMYHSLAHLQKVWCYCKTCKEGREFNVPSTILDFIAVHKRKGCNNIDITIDKNVVPAILEGAEHG